MSAIARARMRRVLRHRLTPELDRMTAALAADAGKPLVARQHVTSAALAAAYLDKRQQLLDEEQMEDGWDHRTCLGK